MYALFRDDDTSRYTIYVRTHSNVTRTTAEISVQNPSVTDRRINYCSPDSRPCTRKETGTMC